MKHREAVEQTIASASLGARHAAIVELCRTLAEQIDDAGESPSARLCASYLSALKDLDRAIGGAPSRPERSKLTQLRSAGAGSSRRSAG